MFLCDDRRYLPYIKINQLTIDGLEINLGEKDDWRSLKKLIIQKYEPSVNKDWYKLNMNISICIDDETGGRGGDQDEKFSFLKKELHEGVSLKIYSQSSKNYKSFLLEDFDEDSDNVISWTGDITVSSLLLSENLYLYHSLVGQLDDFGDQFLNLAGGDSFKREEALILEFDDPEDNLGGKNIKLIKLDFHNPKYKDDNYISFVPRSVKNETHYINADLENSEPIIFVNTHIEEVQTLYNDYQAQRYSQFYIPGKMAVTNLGLQAWNLVMSNIISECISEITSETNDDDRVDEINRKVGSLNIWYLETLVGVAKLLVQDGEEYDQNKVITKFLNNYIEKPDKVNRQIAALFNTLLGIKKETVGYTNNLKKLSFKGSV